MSRSGYSDDLDNWELIKWRGQVSSAIRGKRGQKLLRELAEAMDAMPTKELAANALHVDGAYCALGVVGAKRGVDLSALDPYDQEGVGKAFDIARPLAAEIAAINDDDFGYKSETPAHRWKRVREWVAEQIKDAATETLSATGRSE